MAACPASGLMLLFSFLSEFRGKETYFLLSAAESAALSFVFFGCFFVMVKHK